jgi:hypothetical protein
VALQRAGATQASEMPHHFPPYRVPAVPRGDRV